MSVHKPVGLGIAVTITSATAVISAPFSIQSDTLRVVAVDAATFVAIGTETVATATDYYVPSGGTATLALSPASNRVVGIVTGTTTTITFPEGTGSPFTIGDYVTLTSVGQPYYNFTYQAVTAVNRTSAYDGYYSTRITVAANTLGIVTAFTVADGDLRKSIKISTFGSGSGTLQSQQVQIAGDA
jgi:hypothetical protein